MAQSTSSGVYTAAGAAAVAELVQPSGLSHFGLPIRDVARAKRFYVDALQGELLPSSEGAFAVRFPSRLGDKDWVIHLALQAGGWTAWEAEYPHYGFTVHPEDFVSILQRLDACGVPRHEPWDRYDDTEGLMYFRDPSGNQFETYVLKGFHEFPLRRGHRAGGDYVIPFASLNYSELPPVPDTATPLPPFALDGFNHMTMPVRDHHDSSKFLVAALGGTVVINHPTHITTEVGGIQFGMAPSPGGWTAPDAEFPHYALLVAPDKLQPLCDQIRSFDVPVSPLWSEDGQDARAYFREPSGNLFELHCPSGFVGADTLPPRQEARVDVRALNYERWRRPS